jgi:hypothetical protein
MRTDDVGLSFSMILAGWGKGASRLSNICPITVRRPGNGLGIKHFRLRVGYIYNIYII